MGGLAGGGEKVGSCQMVIYSEFVAFYFIIVVLATYMLAGT